LKHGYFYPAGDLRPPFFALSLFKPSLFKPALFKPALFKPAFFESAVRPWIF